MRGYTFYAEYEDKARTKSTGNCMAVEREYSRWNGIASSMLYEAVTATFKRPNSPVGAATVAQTYLDMYCRKVSETEARHFHPRLFEYLAEAEREEQAHAAH